tara:strand:- start:23 stop:1150 length:1128 start_codon:yes stop_codon:yes gene_type:complete
MNKKVKILYTIPNFDTAGSGIPLFKIASNLDKEKFSIEIACLHERGELFKDVVKNGFKVHIIDLYKKPRPIANMLYQCYKLSLIFQEINPDIIHSYHYAADYTEPIAARLAGIKWLYTKKNMSWHGPSYRGWRLRSLLANGIISQNTTMMKEFFRDWKKVKLIPIGVDFNEYKRKTVKDDILPKWGIKADSRLIITIANLVEVKGIEILIKAFERIHLQYPKWKLMIIGDNRNYYGKKLIGDVKKNKKLDSKIIFTGRQKNIQELLSLAEIYVQPTLLKGRMEGAPIAILEAMANGKIIIGSAIPGIIDQLKEHPEHLFKAGDIINLSKKLIYYLSNDKKFNQEIGRKFINYVKKNYDLSIEKNKLEKYYIEIVS